MGSRDIIRSERKLKRKLPSNYKALNSSIRADRSFDPKKRIRIDDALAHPCFQEVQSNASQGMEKTARVRQAKYQSRNRSAVT